mgnify:FL=1
MDNHHCNQFAGKIGEKNAEGTGVEPVRACAHEFSRLAHYRPAHLPFFERIYNLTRTHFIKNL